MQVRGEIDLLNVNDGEAGIKDIKVYYALSGQGFAPPQELTDSYLQLTDNSDNSNELKLSDGYALFAQEDGVLWGELLGEEEQALIELAVNSEGSLEGFQGWSDEVPELKAGYYLWTKTVYTYLDGTKQVAYSASKIGENGLKGEKGDTGESADSFFISLNQDEILKFTDNLGKTTISPEKLIITIKEKLPDESEGEKQVTSLVSGNLKVSIVNIDNQQEEYQINKTLISIDENKNFVIDLDLLRILGEQSQGTSATDLGAQMFAKRECFLKIVYTHVETLLGEVQTHIITEHINVRYGMNKDMASLSLTAGGIAAAVQNSKMNFNANGLTIQNGGFKILNKNDQQVLYADNSGNLTIEGTIRANKGYFRGDITGASGIFSGSLEGASGSFAGDISAATGTFRGTLKAKDGLIGGFKISENTLISESLNENGIPHIILNGKEGLIEAQNIILGEGARIKDYIQLGDTVQLKSVVDNYGSFVTVKDSSGNSVLEMRADATITVGSRKSGIVIDGKGEQIYTTNFNENNVGWRIDKNEAIFNNITLRGSLRAAVLEFGEIQAVGGIVMIRPSSRILKIEVDEEKEQISFYLEEISGFKINDTCIITTGLTENTILQHYSTITSIDTNNKVITTIPDNFEEAQEYLDIFLNYPLVSLGQTTEEIQDNIGIGLNASTNGAILTPQSLSVFEFKTEPYKHFIPRIILGKLPDEETYGFAKNTYGLFAENALLKGALVTQYSPDSGDNIYYCGMSTLFDRESERSPKSHTNKYFDTKGDDLGGKDILLWAGAEGDTAEKIEKSPFYVDIKGNLYASSAHFTNSVISDAIIQASEVRTSILKNIKVTSAGNMEADSNPALRIQDARYGIRFERSDEEDNTKFISIFDLTESKMTADINEIQFNTNFKIDRKGNVKAPKLEAYQDLTAEGKESPKVSITTNKISYFSDYNTDEENTSFIKFDNTGAIYLSSDEEKAFLKISKDEAVIEPDLILYQSLKYGENIEYKPVYDTKNVIIGCDLYIT